MFGADLEICLDCLNKLDDFENSCNSRWYTG